MRFVIPFCLALMLACLGVVAHAQDAAGLSMTKKQSTALAELTSRPKPWAFAISSSGQWGRAYGTDTLADAEARALGFCRQYLRKGRPDCTLVMRNGQPVVPPANIPEVRDVYKPVNGRKAASIIGRKRFEHKAALEAARQSLSAGQSGSQDRGLRARLQGTTIMTEQTKGFAVWLGPQRAEHMASTNRDVLSVRFARWSVSADGLLCMFDGVWLSSGQPVGRKCLILGDFTSGRGDIYWDGSPDRGRNAQIIAGDGRIGAVSY